MKLLNEVWGVVERGNDWWEARADFVDDGGKIHNECYMYKGEPTQKQFDASIASSIEKLSVIVPVENPKVEEDQVRPEVVTIYSELKEALALTAKGSEVNLKLTASIDKYYTDVFNTKEAAEVIKFTAEPTAEAIK